MSANPIDSIGNVKCVIYFTFLTQTENKSHKHRVYYLYVINSDIKRSFGVIFHKTSNTTAALAPPIAISLVCQEQLNNTSSQSLYRKTGHK